MGSSAPPLTFWAGRWKSNKPRITRIKREYFLDIIWNITKFTVNLFKSRFEYNHREANQLFACTFSAACSKWRGWLSGSHCALCFVHWALCIAYCVLPPNPTPDPSPLGKGRGNAESLNSTTPETWDFGSIIQKQTYNFAQKNHPTCLFHHNITRNICRFH